jgi:hypothetical protein
MRLAVGDTIPVSLQLENGATNQFPRAILYRPDGTVFATLDLVHVANGGYEDDTQTMPALSFVRAVYIVYSDAGRTTESTTHLRAEEKWERDTSPQALFKGTADAGSSNNELVDADLTQADTDYWKGCLVHFTSGAVAGQVRLITAFTPAFDRISFQTETTAAIAAGDTYEILPHGPVDLWRWRGNTPNGLIVGRVEVNVQAIGAAVIGSSNFSSDAITAAVISASAVTEIQAGLATSAALATVQADTDDIQARLPATLSGGRMRSQVEGMDANTLTASALATDAVTEIQAGLAAAEDLAAALGLLHQNSFVDNTVHTGNGTTTARLRQFATEAACAAATDGAADNAQGEIRRWLIETTYDAAEQIATHRIRKVL